MRQHIGYIFDLDGVITDTAQYHYLSWKQMADEEGLPFTWEDNHQLRGVSRPRSLEILLKGRQMTDDHKADMLERKNRYYQDYIQQVTPADLLPGVFDFLSEAHKAGIRLGLGSASKNARTVCERLGIVELFDAFGDGYSVVNTKPAPDLFIWVAGRLDLNPRQCIVFEDAEAGIEAALVGGFWAVGIGPEDRLGSAHWIRGDLRQACIADFPLPPIPA